MSDDHLEKTEYTQSKTTGQEHITLDPEAKTTGYPEGRKDDSGKARLDLIPPELLFALGDILEYGAGKYSERNWEKGMNWGRVYGALQRHLNQWWDSNQSDTDEETGKSHLHHAACCLAFLVAYEQRGKGEDTRA